MPIRPEKEAAVAELQEKFASAKSVVVVDYRGLTVAQATKLRKQLREQGVELKVVKNTLARIATNNLGFGAINDYLVGTTALAFGLQDAVAPAKVLTDFSKENEKLQIKAGLLEGKVIDDKGVKALAALPSREVLLAQVAGALKSPLQGLAMVLNGPLRKTVYALDAVRKQKEAAGA